MTAAHIPGQPLDDLVTGPAERIMFLGGALDHTVRKVPVWGSTGIPDQFYIKPARGREPEQTYLRHRVASGTRSWFTFILEGHTPTRGELLDTNPVPI